MAALLAACGGGGGGESTAGSTTATSGPAKGPGGSKTAAGGSTGSGGSKTGTGGSKTGSTTAGGGEGGGGGEAPASGKTLAEQADEICEAATKRQSVAFVTMAKARQQHPLKGQSEQEGLEEIVRKSALPPVLAAARELSELGGSSAAEAKLDEIADGLEEAAKKAEADPLSVAGNSKSEDPFKTVDEIAAAAGYKACASLG